MTERYNTDKRFSDVREEEIPEFIKKFKPPPPPGREDLWELQFCRWWGWNWVRKREGQQGHESQPPVNQERQNTVSRTPPPKRQENKVQARHFKDLCKCLCFKKAPRETKNLQSLYKTPSNSVMCLCEAFTTGLLEQDTTEETYSHMAMQRTVTTNKREACINKGCSVQSWVSVQGASSDSRTSGTISSDACCDQCYCCEPDADPRRKTTDESLEYLNMTCCACESLKKSNSFQKRTCVQRRILDNNQTQTSKCKVADCQTATRQSPIMRICGTQTQVNSRKYDKETNFRHKESLNKSHRKCIKVVCCHCCCCCNCNCNCNGKDEKPVLEKVSKSKRPSVVQNISDIECTCNMNNREPTTVYQCKPETTNVVFEKPVKLNEKMENAKQLINYRPWDGMFYNQKSFSKFGMPSKRYPWLDGTKSDILDYSSLKLDQKFASPMTGKTYRLKPVKVDSVIDMTNSSLPDPMDVEEEIRYLKKLENQVERDFESRIMLDAICDAILCKDVESKSTIMNDYTYDSNAENTFTDFILDSVRSNENDNSGEEPTNLNKDIINNWFDIVNKHKNDTTLQRVEELLKRLVESNKKDVSPSTKSYNSKRDEIQKSSEQLNIFDFDEEIHDKKSNESSRYICESYQESFMEYHQPSFNQGGILSAIKSVKRTASPVHSQPNKKLKQYDSESSGDNLIKNFDELFNKIDQIALTSKANDEKIQCVINSIPCKAKCTTSNNFESVINENPSGICKKIDDMVMQTRDYVNLEKYDSTKNSVIDNLEIFTTLTTISENMEDKIENKECRKIFQTTSLEAVGSKPIIKKDSFTKKRKKQSKKSLIPIKKGSSIKNMKK